MSYDRRCDELARTFLSDVGKGNDESLIAELAQHIQDSIEEYLEAKELHA